MEKEGGSMGLPRDSCTGRHAPPPSIGGGLAPGHGHGHVQRSEWG